MNLEEAVYFPFSNRAGLEPSMNSPKLEALMLRPARGILALP